LRKSGEENTKLFGGHLSSQNIVLIAILGLAIRFALAPFTAHPFDVYFWYSLSTQIVSGKSMASLGIGYLPMLYYTLVPVAYSYSHLSIFFNIHPTSVATLPKLVQSAIGWTVGNVSVPVLTDPLFNLLVKIPFIIADFFSGVIIYKIAKTQFGETVAHRAFLVWFLNPMLIWVSAVWGMYDSLPAFFALLATYLALKNKYALSAASLAVAIGYKIYPILLLVPLTVYIYRKERSVKKLILPAFILTVGSTILFLPWALSGFFTEYYGVHVSAPPPAENPAETFGLTYWSFAPFTSISGTDAHIISLFTLAALTVAMVALIARKLTFGGVRELFLWELVAISVIFLSWTTVDEQWFVWLLPFLVLLFAGKVIDFSKLISLSLLSLGYSFVNSQFVAFFAQLYIYNPNGFLTFARDVVTFAAVRLPLMAILGVAFSVALVYWLYEAYKRSQVSARESPISTSTCE
jgi:hypothetical protein